MKSLVKSFLLILSFALISCDIAGVFDSITGADDDKTVKLYPVEIDGRWGYINQNGALVLEPEFRFAGNFSEGLAHVYNSDRDWVYINKNGEEVIDEEFDAIYPFSDGRAAVRLDGLFGYINKNGRFVVNPRFREAHPFSDGRAFVRSIDYQDYYYIDENGDEIESVNMPDDLDPLDDNLFYDGRALVLDNDLYGYIDKEGNTVVELKYSEALPFSNNLAAVRVSDRWGFIDANGEVVISPQFISAGKFGNGLAPARKNSNDFGYINKEGQFTIQEQFEEVRPFNEERAPVMIDNKWTFIDMTGKQIAPAEFDEVDPFYNGLARVFVQVPVGEDEINTLFGYINKTGDYVWYPTD